MAPELLTIIIVAIAAPFVLLPESISPRFVPWLLLLNYVKELDGTRPLFYRLRFMLIWMVLSCIAAFALAMLIDQIIIWLAVLVDRMFVANAPSSNRAALANPLFETRLVVVPLLVVISYGAIAQRIKYRHPNQTLLHNVMLANSVTDAERLTEAELSLADQHAAARLSSVKPQLDGRVASYFKTAAKRIFDHCCAPFDFEFELWLRHAMAELLFARFGEKNVLKALLCEPQLVYWVRKTNDEIMVDVSLELLQTGTRTAIHKRAGQLLIDVFATKLGYFVLQDRIERYLKSTCAQTIAGNSAPAQRPKRAYVIGIRVEYQVVGERQLREAELVNFTQSGDDETGLFLGTGARQFLSQRPISVIRPAPTKTTVEFIHREAQVMQHRLISGWGLRVHRAASTAPARDQANDKDADAWQHIVF